MKCKHCYPAQFTGVPHCKFNDQLCLREKDLPCRLWEESSTPTEKTNPNGGIIEMTCSPTPQWLKDFKEEIQKEFNLSLLDAACIAGKVAKIVRIREQKIKKDFLEILKSLE